MENVSSPHAEPSRPTTGDPVVIPSLQLGIHMSSADAASEPVLTTVRWIDCGEPGYSMAFVNMGEQVTVLPGLAGPSIERHVCGLFPELSVQFVSSVRVPVDTVEPGFLISLEKTASVRITVTEEMKPTTMIERRAFFSVARDIRASTGRDATSDRRLRSLLGGCSVPSKRERSCTRRCRTCACRGSSRRASAGTPRWC